MERLQTAAGRVGQLAITMFVACLATLVLAAGPAVAGVVPTDKGPVRGVTTAQTKQYLGIPYAAAPVGNLRWRPPQPAARWHGPRDVTSFAPHCAQNESPFGSASTSEDCLYLNVYTPNTGKKGKGHAKDLPVMVWLHGGALQVGESDDYDPTRLVAQGRIVVTINYRLGNLGFLTHPALSAEAGSSGNYGLMDQQAALRWVQRNIKKFGGDAAEVTIFGESAGGLSVHAQLASPGAAGLFDRAIAESGAYSLNQPTLSQAEQRGALFAQQLGCVDQTATCLRSVPVETLLANQPVDQTTVPDVDGVVLPRSIGDAFRSGDFNRVPVVEGSNHDEFALFAATNIEFVFTRLAWTPSLYEFVVIQFVQTLGLPVTPEALLAEYPLSPSATSSAPNVIAIGTDALFACPARRAARALSQFVPTFEYEFNDPDAPQLFIPPASFDYGAYHAAEIAYLFDSTTLGGHAPFTTDQEALAAAMVRYWTRFAGQGNPNGSGTPQWPAYTAAGDLFQSLEPPTPATASGFAADHHCGFWDSL